MNNLKFIGTVLYGSGISFCAIRSANDFAQIHINLCKSENKKIEFRNTYLATTLGLIVGIGEGLILPVSLFSTALALPTIIKKNNLELKVDLNNKKN